MESHSDSATQKNIKLLESNMIIIVYYSEVKFDWLLEYSSEFFGCSAQIDEQSSKTAMIIFLPHDIEV